MTKSLLAELTEYGNGDVYPYHMPGHKRNGIGNMSMDVSHIDITEIDGFDNMHYPEGILLAAQKRAAKLYGADQTFFLVNGSTVGNLAAISGTVSKGGKLLIPRNCHKSVYHGAYLREIDLVFIEPDVNEQFGFCEPVTAEQVEKALAADQQIEAVLVVSPTYEGRVANIREIADVVHAYHIPLIVDEAHGAHLGLNDHFAPSSVQAGADLVIHSLHKTLPSLTQTALLHVKGNIISVEDIQKFLRIYQSSSPSYIFMASMDECIREMTEQGNVLMERFYNKWNHMLSDLQTCKNLEFPMGDMQDIGKLVISVRNTSMTGVQLYEELLHTYRLQMEMACDTYVLAMFTVGDGEEAFLRMQEALHKIDEEISRKPRGWEKNDCFPQKHRDVCEQIPFWKAYDMAKKEMELGKAVGCFAGEFVSVYPPGVPILIPGEKITEEYIATIIYNLEKGLNVQGIRETEGVPMISVLK